MDDIKRPKSQPAMPDQPPRSSAATPQSPPPSSPEQNTVNDDRNLMQQSTTDTNQPTELDSQHIAMNHKINKRKKGPLIAIILAIFITIILIGIAVYVFLLSNTQQTTAPASQPTPSTEAPVEGEGRVTPDEITNTGEDIERTLNSLDDTADISPNELNDGTIGL